MHVFFLSLLLFPMDKLGWEVFELPSAAQWRMLLLNAGMGTLFNVSFVAAVSLLSPTLVSVSCLLTVPIAAMADLLLNQYRDADEQVKKLNLVVWATIYHTIKYFIYSQSYIHNYILIFSWTLFFFTFLLQTYNSRYHLMLSM